MGEQDVDQLAVGEPGVLQGEAYAVQGVVGEPAGLLAGGAGRGERVPGAARRVGGLVLHGVEEVGEPAEEAAGLGERRGVLRAAREDGGVGEGGGGRGLGRLGDGEQGRAGPGDGLDAGLAVDGVDEDGGVEAEVAAGPGAGPVPGAGDPAGRGGDGPARQQAVPVGDVVPYLRRGEDERDGGGEPGPLAPGHGRGPHAAQRAGPGGAAAARHGAGLSLRQDRDDEPVVVGDDPGELAVVGAEREAEAAEVGHPLDLEVVGEPVRAGSDDSEQGLPRESWAGAARRPPGDRCARSYGGPYGGPPSGLAAS